jgi:serine/threonine protein kinase
MLQTEQLLQERYRLRQQLGNNAGRQTWLAQDISTSPPSPVIVKLLAFSPQMQWEEFKLFEREAQVLKSLNRPRLPQYRDYFSIDAEAGEGLCWFALVQDYISGKSLQQLLDEGYRFNEQQVCSIAVQVLEILHDLHGLNPPLLHRDIKPSNLILGTASPKQEDPPNPSDPAGSQSLAAHSSPSKLDTASNSPLSKRGHREVYLIDFGAVCDATTVEGATFTVVGTAGYAPLEQFWGKAVPASDLYALGATLIHLLTGIPPSELPQQNLRVEFRDKVNLNSTFLRWLEALTEPDLSQRFSSASQALEALQTGSALPKLSKPPDSRVRLRKSPKRLTIKIPKRPRSLKNSLKIFGEIFWKPILSLGSKIFFLIPFLFGIGLSVSVIMGFLLGDLMGLALIIPLILGTLLWWSWRQNKSEIENLVSELNQWAEREIGFSSIIFYNEYIYNYYYYDRFFLEPPLRWFGISIGRYRQHPISEIDNLEATPWEGIVIELESEKYVLGQHLREIECEWIVQEIKDWIAESKIKQQENNAKCRS